MTRRGVLLALALLVPLGGCLEDEVEPRTVAGPTNGYDPTNSFLKVHIRTDEAGIVLAAFDRRDWYVAGVAKEVDGHHARFMEVTGLPRTILGEVLVDEVHEPADIMQYKYEGMAVSEEERMRLDREYDELLERLGVEEAPPLPEETGGLEAPAVPGPQLAKP